MKIQGTGDHLRNDVTPFVFLTERNEEFGNRFENRTNVELRILEEGEEKFRGTVTSAAAHAGDCTVEIIDVVDDSLDRVAESELLVVVTMETKLLRLHMLTIAIDALVDIFLVEVTEGIHEVKDV